MNTSNKTYVEFDWVEIFDIMIAKFQPQSNQDLYRFYNFKICQQKIAKIHSQCLKGLYQNQNSSIDFDSPQQYKIIVFLNMRAAIYDFLSKSILIPESYKQDCYLIQIHIPRQICNFKTCPLFLDQ
ncbi:unnamed protein product (macronuclear) [Paramecium tetraurelia]|uniref:Uncharacterized protein n=1 Tax=Paramecium tetraurelia TaxID=5888 RepID=A0CUQ9_PARTE|nr:uncharacterized protein GSPATT00010727001 [Paramecium tetraurelia]CAK74526.1 unnamed protein product [Paramecium tetraurelia]|eukprot:XP_001441923.1 hypothetical protein (macronuclear) [Paramecium tetraurelia strain d4-2]